MFVFKVHFTSSPAIPWADQAPDSQVWCWGPKQPPTQEPICIVPGLKCYVIYTIMVAMSIEIIPFNIPVRMYPVPCHPHPWAPQSYAPQTPLLCSPILRKDFWNEMQLNWGCKMYWKLLFLLVALLLYTWYVPMGRFRSQHWLLYLGPADWSI